MSASMELSTVAVTRQGTNPNLPAPWRQARTPQGRVYYLNDVTKKTQWEFPVEALDIPPPPIDATHQFFDGSLASDVHQGSRRKLSRKQTTMAEDDADVKAKIITYLLVAVGIGQAFMSCLLVVFVPQQCPNTCIPPLQEGQCGTHTCEFSENFTDLQPHNKASLGFNFIVFIFVIMQYFVIGAREKFMIRYLDEDMDLPATHFKTLEDTYVEVKEGLDMHNTRLLRSSVALAVVFIINAVLSGITLRVYQDGFRTWTTFATNLTLLVAVLASSISLGWKGLSETIGESLTVTRPCVYNTIDNTYLEELNKAKASNSKTTLQIEMAPRINRLASA